MKVKFYQGVDAFYVDGRECYQDPSGHWLFVDTFELVALYVAATVRGKPIQRSERLFFRDGNVGNIHPSNLFVAGKEPNEAWQVFYSRIQKSLQGQYKRSLPLRKRVRDLHTRECSGKLPLYNQISLVQHRVDELWLRKFRKPLFGIGFDKQELIDCAKTNIRFRCPDVRLEDIIFDEPPKQVVELLKSKESEEPLKYLRVKDRKQLGK